MGSNWGENIHISIFGQSHSAAIGVVIEGLPAGFRPDIAGLSEFLGRRAPGRSSLATQRRETDSVEFLSGIADGVLCGAPLSAIIRNTDTRPGDYSAFSDLPRPGHADFTAQAKFHGFQDPSGGGHFSGRLTAPLCIAGGLCLQLLWAEGIRICAHIERVADVTDERFDPVNPAAGMDRVKGVSFLVIDQKTEAEMKERIADARDAGDSVGGVIECAAFGLPTGIGDPMFDGMENRISQTVFAIPGVKGLEFGAGFACATIRGSENNDPFVRKQGVTETLTNNHGGILGGITSGMPLIFRVAVKPTPSIAMEQRTVSLTDGKESSIAIRGRHDPCIVPRAVPCVEAAAAIAIYDELLSAKKYL